MTVGRMLDDVLTSPIAVTAFSTFYVYCTLFLVAMQIGGLLGWIVEAMMLSPTFSFGTES